MKKIAGFLCCALFIGNIFFGNKTASAEASSLSKEDAYRAIVKVQAFAKNELNFLTLYSQGSGIIISPSGLVLTNSHVVTLESDLDGSELETSYIICIAENISTEPDCSYTARLISKNKDLDVALLQIDNIFGLSDKKEFPYLNLNIEDTVNVNDEVVVLGYPAIGGETITMTKGIISGKLDKYEKKWIKTDAVVSFGNSGGAAIDSAGKIIGITSASHSDLLGSLGYIIQVPSVSRWIEENKSKAPKENTLLPAVASFAKRRLQAESGNVFNNDFPRFSIEKPDGWKFEYTSEQKLDIKKNIDAEDSGEVLINIIHAPYIVDINSILPIVTKAQSDAGVLALVSVSREGSVNINGNKGKSFVFSYLGKTLNTYYFPLQSDIIEIIYGYGQNDKDHDAVDGIINSLQMYKPSSPVSEKHSHDNPSPKFSIKTGSEWVIQTNNSKGNPVTIWNKNIPYAFIDVSIIAEDESTKNLDNAGFLEKLKQTIKEINQQSRSLFDYEYEWTGSNAHYKINNEIRDAIRIEYIERTANEKRILSYGAEYDIKTGNSYISMSLDVYSPDKKLYAKALASFQKVLQSFSLIKTAGISVMIDSWQEREKKFVIRADKKLIQRLYGQIVLQVEEGGQAWYVDGVSQRKYYLPDGASTLAAMKKFGIQVSDKELWKIPIGINSALAGADSDKDGLSDKLEEALKTDPKNPDTDSDGYLDGVEVMGGYNPKGSAKILFDKNIIARMKGKILLQKESRGEAWYVNPKDGRRYFLADGNTALKILKSFGTGITNQDLRNIPVGSL